MFKKTITYKDFDGKDRIEDAYFNLTKSEMIDFALELPEQVSDAARDNTDNTKDMDVNKAVSKLSYMLGTKGVHNFIKDLILKSYGVRKDEGRRFAKTDDNGVPLYIGFSQTMAFETIMEEFRSNDIEAAKFVKALIPADVADKMPNVTNIVNAASVEK